MVAASGCRSTDTAVLLRLRRSHVCLAAMTSYLSGLAAYSYRLPCGHAFKSNTRSVADDRDGCHWFWCGQCRVYSNMWEADCRANETPPLRRPSGMRMSDAQHAKRTDEAIMKDRIAAVYRRLWDTVSVREVAKALGVHKSLVQVVALDLGVYGVAGTAPLK